MDVNHQHQVPNQPRMLPSNFLQAQADSQGYGNQWAFPTLQDNSMLRTAARRGV
jgi:hypothetical protein